MNPYLAAFLSIHLASAVSLNALEIHLLPGRLVPQISKHNAVWCSDEPALAEYVSAFSWPSRAT